LILQSNSRIGGRPKHLGHNSHHIQHPPRNTLLPAMRKVSQSPSFIPSTSRTLAHHRNPLLANTRIQQLPPIRLPEIQPHLTSVLSAEKFLRIPELRSKLGPHLLPHRIAASPDARPHRRHHVLGPRPILRPHHRDPMLDDPRYRPSPPRMKRRDHPLLHIDYQHRHAIRRPHTQQHPLHACHQPITLQHRLTLSSLKPPLQCPVRLPHHPHGTRVDLPHSHQHRTITSTTNCLQKPPSILCHKSRIVLLRPPKIQRIPSVNRRNPAHPPTEPMPQPPILLPATHPHNLWAAFTANSLILNAQPATSSFRPIVSSSF
jgi:hypothetical protein